jgi:sphingosine kinase
MKKFYLVTNPVSGTKSGLRFASLVKNRLSTSGALFEETITKHSRHIEGLISELNLDQYDGLIIIGGDGSMHEAVNGLLKRKDNKNIPIGLIPAGSGNAFLHDLNLLNPLDAINAILNGVTTKVDVASISYNNESRFSFNIIGWGLVTNIGLTAEKMRWIGTSRYTLASIIEALKFKPQKATLVIDEKEFSSDLLFVMVCNTIHSGKGMKIAPKAKLDDGKFDLVVVHGDLSKVDVFKLLPKVFDGSHIKHPLVKYLQAKSFSILPKTNNILNIDGELCGKTPIHGKVVPKAIEVFIN